MEAYCYFTLSRIFANVSLKYLSSCYKYCNFFSFITIIPDYDFAYLYVNIVFRCQLT